MFDKPEYPLPTAEEAMKAGHNLLITEVSTTLEIARKSSGFIAYFLGTRSHGEELFIVLSNVYAAGKISGVRAERSKRRAKQAAA